MIRRFAPLLAVLALACSKGGGEGAGQGLLAKESGGVPRVRTVKVTAGGETVISATGTLFPAQETIVMAEVPGKVVKLYAEEGDSIKAGAPLVDLDRTDFGLGVQQAEAQHRAAQLALAETEVEWQRVQKLHSEGAVARAAYDGMKLKYDLTENQVRLARVGLAYAQRRLSLASIKAPYDALVVNRLVSVGSVIQVMPPTVLFRLQDAVHLRLKARVPESAMRSVAAGDGVEARFEAAGRTVTSRITAVVPSIDPMSRTFEVVADIDNSRFDMALKPGMFATVRIVHAGGEERVAISRSATIAVAGSDGEVRAFVVEEGKARERRVKVAGLDAASYTVTDGLKAGDDLVVAGFAGLADGMTVVATPQ